MLNGFNTIAKIYDTLAKIVFGRVIKKAQLHFLNEIPIEAKVLILGGGTGWILNSILKIRPAVEVWYIEASTKMISIAKKKVVGFNNIHFIHGTEQNIPVDQHYDVVITNFYFDLLL